MSTCQERMISSPQEGGGLDSMALVVSSTFVILILILLMPDFQQVDKTFD